MNILEIMNLLIIMKHWKKNNKRCLQVPLAKLKHTICAIYLYRFCVKAKHFHPLHII